MHKKINVINIVIYGDSDFAEQAFFQFKGDTRYRVLAFTVDNAKYIKRTKNDLPIIPFQKLKTEFFNDNFQIFPAIGYSNHNIIRELVINEIEQAGYTIFTYISKQAYIELDTVIGVGSYICEFVSVGNSTTIGKGVVILANSTIGHNNKIDSFCYLSYGVTSGGFVTIKNNSFIGLNTTIRNSITIGKYNIIGAGSNVIKSTEANSMYVGNPAKRLKDVDINNLNF